jgi:hypothetical protein
MGTKIICDYCLKEITADSTVMTVQTIDPVTSTAKTDAVVFEFHPGCYNVLQGLIITLRTRTDPPPLDPTSPPPEDQPTNPDDPSPVVPEGVGS